MPYSKNPEKMGLDHHLTARIKSACLCSYHPHPDRPVAWKF